MAKRSKTATAQLKVRMREPLRAALEDAAERRGVSLNAETVARLERSLLEEKALGGPEMQRLSRLMTIAFATGARLRAGDTAPSIDDPSAYRAGMFAVVDALLMGLPGATHEDVAQEIEVLKGRLVSRIVRERVQEEEQFQ